MYSWEVELEEQVLPCAALEFVTVEVLVVVVVAVVVVNG
jgi:hypothetical protein